MSTEAEPTPSSDGADALVGSVIAERYRVLELLGEGGMGAVYRAEHVLMKRVVALKVLHRSLTVVPEVVARFEREAIVAGKLEHPNVVSALDFGRMEDGSCYLTMELVSGRSLAEELQRGPLSLRRALEILRQVVSGLAAAHAAGVVHRDLKPDNVMLVGRDEEADLVKLLDFGIAKLDSGTPGPALTRLGAVFGTPEYMAPEQVQGAEVDARADLYAVGVILYELLTGATPFAEGETLRRQLLEPPPPLPESVPRGVVALTLALLEKDPAQRPQSAEEVGLRLEELLAGLDDAAALAAPSVAALSFSPTVASFSGVEADVAPSAGHERALRPSLLPRALAQLKRPVSLGPLRFPLGVPVALALALVVFVSLSVTGLLVMWGQRTRAPLTAASGDATVVAQQGLDEATLASAATGDAKALAAVEALDEATRSAVHWRAIARGRTRRGDSASAVQALGRAFEQDGTMKADEALLSDLRLLAEERAASIAALDLAAGLGAVGADLIYDVSTGATDPETRKRAAERLELAQVRASSSPALQVVLALKRARGCAGFADALDAAVEHADARALARLKQLTATRGCGTFKRSDCWSCLRGDDRLKRAIERAEATAAPKF